MLNFTKIPHHSTIALINHLLRSYYIMNIAGYWTQETSFLADVDKTGETTYYDSVTGKKI